MTKNGEMIEKDKVKHCNTLLRDAMKSSPLVSLLIFALDQAGCNFNISRHVSCEKCGPGLAGGFDKETNQLVLCTDYCQDDEKVTSTLAHELVHMYDYCTTNINFANIDELACTEVRAANLADCRDPLSSLLTGLESVELTKMHSSCVRTRAVRSVRAIGGVPYQTALSAVDRVFNRCYSDLEPVGRRCEDRQAELRAFKELLVMSRSEHQTSS